MNLTPGYVSFDDTATVPALLAPGTWNGWAMPFLTREGAETLFAGCPGWTVQADADGELAILSATSDDHRLFYPLTIPGHPGTWYDFTGEGLTFNFEAPE